MTKYVALLRGIAPMNPNMRNERLRELFEELGFANVHTIIASGNVVFETTNSNIPALEAQIEAALPIHLGFTSTTIIRSQAQLQKLMEIAPFKDLEHSPKTHLNVTFLKKEPVVKLTYPYQPENREYQLLGMNDRALFSVIDITSAKTPDLMTWLDKQFGKEITTRTWKTVQRIIQKMQL